MRNKEYDDLIENIKNECGLDTVNQTIDYILFHHSTFKREFVEYVYELPTCDNYQCDKSSCNK